MPTQLPHCWTLEQRAAMVREFLNRRFGSPFKVRLSSGPPPVALSVEWLMGPDEREVEDAIASRFPIEWQLSPRAEGSAYAPSMVIDGGLFIPVEIVVERLGLGDLTAEEANDAMAVGEDPNAEDQYGITPLLRAIHRHDFDLVAALIEGGADIDKLCCAGVARDQLNEQAPELVQQFHEQEADQLLAATSTGTAAQCRRL